MLNDAFHNSWQFHCDFHLTWFFCMRVQRSSTSVPHSLATCTQAWAYCPALALLRFSLSPAGTGTGTASAPAADWGCFSLWAQPRVPGVTPTDTPTTNKPRAQQWKGLEATACVAFFRAPVGSESLERVSFEDMHQVEREATATSRPQASFKWKQCLNLNLFIHLLRQVKQSYGNGNLSTSCLLLFIQCHMHLLLAVALLLLSTPGWMLLWTSPPSCFPSLLCSGIYLTKLETGREFLPDTGGQMVWFCCLLCPQ